MDARLRELERAALGGDETAQKQFNAALCRLDGHRYTAFHCYEDYTNNQNWVKVRVCWRCHNPEVVAQQTPDKLEVPEFVLWKSNLHNSPIHALLDFKATRKVRRRARGRRRKSDGSWIQLPPPVHAESLKIEIKAKTACNQDIKTLTSPEYTLQLMHGPKWNRGAKREVTCQRCLRSSKLPKAREKAAAIYKDVYDAAFDRIQSMALMNDGSSDYLPPFDLKHDS